MGYTLCLFLACMVDVINLCRNISEGVRPLIPPCSLTSLYALTNISYLNLPSSMFCMSSNARNSFFTILLYASIFPWQLWIRVWYSFILDTIMYKEMSEYVRCKLLSIIMHHSLGLTSIVYYPIFYTLRTSTDLFLPDHLLATFLEQSSRQLIM